MDKVQRAGNAADRPVTEKVQLEGKKVTCYLCKGTGKYRGSGCSSCKSSGKVNLEDCPTLHDALRKLANGAALSWEPDYRQDYEPTNTQPGCAEKIQVMRLRLSRGQPIFHPRDYDGT